MPKSATAECAGEARTETQGSPAPASPANASAERRHHVVEILILMQLIICHCRDWRMENRGGKKERGVDKILVRKKIGLVVPFRP